MHRVLGLVVALVAVSSPAGAQSLFYAGGTATANVAERGTLDVGKSFPAAGGLIGWRINDGWSLEFHADRGFADGPPHFRLGHFGNDTLEDRAAEGWAVFAVWKSRPLGRASIAATMGIAERRYRTDQTIGSNRPPNLPPNDPLLQNRTGKTSAAGPMGGVMVPIGLGGQWSIAPEVRVGMRWSSEGIYGDGLYLEVQPGVRLMWGF